MVANVTITTRLVDTVTLPMQLKTPSNRGRPTPQLITHRFPLEKIVDAYEVFGHAASTQALKVIISA